MANIFLGLGTNLGKRKQNLKQALELLSEGMEIESVSPIYETEPVGYSEQPLFLNLVLQGTTPLKPERLLSWLKQIEDKLGRVPSFPNGPRVIDLDILFYDNKVISKENLVIPHPRLTVRAFVLVPLIEIAPDFVHPGNGRAIKSLVQDLGKISGLHRWGEAEEIWQGK
jgi:2-amino-4-hydroxy-6-hydroxymethyldihydropteridine diphosphokinase